MTFLQIGKVRRTLLFAVRNFRVCPQANDPPSTLLLVPLMFFLRFESWLYFVSVLMFICCAFVRSKTINKGGKVFIF